MAPVQTQTITPHQFTIPISGRGVISGRISRPTPRSTRIGKPLLSYTPQVPTAHPDINLTLLRNKLLLTCRNYVPSALLHEALADGIWARAERWITPSSSAASRFGKRKRYFVLHTATWTFQQMGSAWEARILSNSQPIDAGNGVVVFVKERPEWECFMRGYKQQGRRGAGQLLKVQQQSTERGWKEEWKRKCGLEDGDGRGNAKKEVNAGPMWVLVKSAVARIVRGEA
ncbi:hypothetical protein P153DRAFT_299138 [Dothidotthia symphoricarpi CBS 119687]|uniref:Uncharacterized protein n=1 Tax=Dothidotthia symphoricarpi CBS 119687 TaxID=1392245 RepID=A0A6A6A1K7_9PLEO|nr:uncharacterized protein P153DRAFT_299138 [Dothidotthia symphoricarpi CBS 119687]KAF2125700.1 hypothetical protein P153DRAFT_299138 [Dothidotthia symphoricarpi CBS 119687]